MKKAQPELSTTALLVRMTLDLAEIKARLQAMEDPQARIARAVERIADKLEGKL